MSSTWDWAELATENLIQSLYLATGTPPPADLAPLQQLLTNIFASTGGVPASHDLPNLSSLAEQLLGNACTAYLIAIDGQQQQQSMPAIALVDADGTERTQHRVDLPFDEVAVATPICHINWASANELATLPVIGIALAESIVAERRAAGAFLDPADLDRRITGLGPDGLRRLAGCLSYTTGVHRREFDPTSAGVFALASALSGATTEGDPVVGCLESILAVTSATPSPATTSRRLTPIPTPKVLTSLSWSACDWGASLVDEQYPAHLPDLLAAATHAVDVCMFHIAVGKQTQSLIDALIAAAGRGVAVRTLLDKDRPEDPYNSNVVNARARKILEAGGVTVRLDPAGSLLHSKYLVIDDDLVVLGSHNWSAGSFATFDDVTVVLHSPVLTDKLRSRFESVWTIAHS